MSKSIIEEKKKCCYICGTTGCLEEHHIFFGSGKRKLSEKAGMKVHLCYHCHRDGKAGIHGQNHEMDLHLKRIGQQVFEKSHSRKEFMDLYGKNYLDEEDSRTQPAKTNDLHGVNISQAIGVTLLEDNEPRPPAGFYKINEE